MSLVGDFEELSVLLEFRIYVEIFLKLRLYTFYHILDYTYLITFVFGSLNDVYGRIGGGGGSPLP